MTDEQIKHKHTAIMKATDLMIGDWVKIIHHHTPKPLIKVKKVDLEDFRDAILQVYPEITYEPIPLTPEILEKNGFIKVLSSSSKLCGWYLEKDLVAEYYVIDITYNNDRLYIEIHGSATVEKYCDYVHEFQHALCLCGIDKTITL